MAGSLSNFDLAEKTERSPLSVIPSDICLSFQETLFPFLEKCFDGPLTPLMRQAADRAIILYDLMDSAYDNVAVDKASADLGHQAIIDFNRRRGEDKPMDPADAVRYRKRSTAERGNSRFKDEFGARLVRARGHSKVHMRLMSGLLALFGDRILQPPAGL